MNRQEMSTNPRVCFCWVVALQAEADPLIEEFGLTADSTDRSWKMFSGSTPGDSESGIEHRLLVCGVGAIQAAAGTAVLEERTRHFSSPGHWRVWVNIGIAGSNRVGELGTLFLATKVSCNARGKSWFPSFALLKSLRKSHRKAQVHTFATPQVFDTSSDTASEPVLADMEAAGFYPIALRNATTEWVHVIKVVSDDSQLTFKTITPKSVRSLLVDRISEIRSFFNALANAAEDQALATAPLESLEWLVERFHFTATEAHQLKRLLERCSAIDEKIIENDCLEKLVASQQKGSEVIRELKARLSEVIASQS